MKIPNEVHLLFQKLIHKIPLTLDQKQRIKEATTEIVHLLNRSEDVYNDRIIRAGSSKKTTAICTDYDVDIVIMMNLQEGEDIGSFFPKKRRVVGQDRRDNS